MRRPEALEATAEKAMLVCHVFPGW